jgi:hypothetical protein
MKGPKMEGKEISQIPIKDYIYQSDETLQEIISYYSPTYTDTKADGKYRLAYELYQLRITKKLVQKTWWLAITTMIVAAATIGVAIGTFILAYY